MKINGQIRIKFNSSKNCETIFRSLEIDNENFIEPKIMDNEIIYNISSEKLGTFLATVDDLIASEIIAEKILITTNDNWFTKQIKGSEKNEV